MNVAVCACTYRRPDGLTALLEGLDRQNFVGYCRQYGHAPRISIIIVDNDSSDEAALICERFSLRAGRNLKYAREPKRGISYARNKCLDLVSAEDDFLAMIDDDEVPESDWLDQLLLVQASVDADIVQGRVVAVFDEGTPRWIVHGNFFGRPRRIHGLEYHEHKELQKLESAGAGNVLVRNSLLRCLNLRFDTDLALTGGEDTAFFRTLRRQGASIVYTGRAVVHERYPRTRANLRYMITERFRMGNVKGALSRKENAAGRLHGRRNLLRESISDFRFGIRRILKTILSRRWEKDRLALGAFQAAYGLGTLAALFGIGYEHYKNR